MHRVLVNVAASDWAVHFIAPDGQTRIGPWLLHNSHEEVLKILHWCGIAEEKLAGRHSAIRRWGCSSAVVMLTDAKLKTLIELAVERIRDEADERSWEVPADTPQIQSCSARALAISWFITRRSRPSAMP